MNYIKNIFTQKVNISKMIKIAFGSAAAIFIAQILGLKYVTSAGIITLLSIQDTKKATINIAIKRIFAYITALITAFISFKILGFNVSALVLYLAIFVSLCMAFGLQDGISMCTVLVTHFFTEKSMAIAWILNESMLMAVGTAMGILLNLYMPRDLKHIRRYQYMIEVEIKYILKELVFFLNETKEHRKILYNFDKIEGLIEDAISKAYMDKENILSYDLKYFINYMEMRKSQVLVLKYIVEQSRELKTKPEQARDIADLINNLIPKLHESNNAINALMDLYYVKDKFNRGELPKNRLEFEDRAILYSIMINFEQFLEIKREFAENISDDDKKNFWE